MRASTPVSSKTSRAAASSLLSPGSICPFGRTHSARALFGLTSRYSIFPPAR